MRACTTGGVLLFLTATGGADVARGKKARLGNNVAGVTRNIVGEAGQIDISHEIQRLFLFAQPDLPGRFSFLRIAREGNERTREKEREKGRD